jgi:small-conductance mechanosensitive channel
MLLSVVDAVFGRLPVEPSVLSAFFDSALEFGFGFLMVYLFGRYVVKPSLRFLLKFRDTIAEPAVRQLVVQLSEVVSFVVGIWVGLHFAGAAGVISGTATIISAGTLAIGVASRDIISNLTSGLFLIADPQFEVGDWVEWNDHEGVVEEIGIRVSRIRTFENRTIVVPNSELGTTALVNHDDKDRIKVVIPVGVGYGEDLAVVKKVAVDEALKIDGVMRDPLPGVSVVGLGASWVDLKVAIWIDESNHTTMIEARDELVSRIKARFRDENISMPAKKRSMGGQIQVANIDSDKLSPAAETKIQDPSEIDLPVDVSEIEQGKQESEEDLASSFTTAVENAVDFEDDDGTADSTEQNSAGKTRGSTGGKQSKGKKKDLVVGDEPSENGDGGETEEKSTQDDGDN